MCRHPDRLAASLTFRKSDIRSSNFWNWIYWLLFLVGILHLLILTKHSRIPELDGSRDMATLHV
jgi:hypothetical protein